MEYRGTQNWKHGCQLFNQSETVFPFINQFFKLFVCPIERKLFLPVKCFEDFIAYMTLFRFFLSTKFSYNAFVITVIDRTLCELNSNEHLGKGVTSIAAVYTWPLFSSLRHNFCWHFSRVA